MKKTLVLLTVLVASMNAFAGTNIAKGSKITEISSISGENKDSFLIRVSGGEGSCVDGTWILFPVSASPSKEAHARTYQTLLNAFDSNRKISVHNFVDESCNNASQVSLKK